MTLRNVIAALALLLLGACSPSGETTLAGTVLFQDRPLAGATVEIYLKGEKDRATLPFASIGSDEGGRWRLPSAPSTAPTSRRTR